MTAAAKNLAPEEAEAETVRDVVPDQLADIKPFRLKGVLWRCWLIENGQRYEWRAEGRPLFVSRNVGASTYGARIGDRRVGNWFANAREAMANAIHNYNQRTR